MRHPPLRPLRPRVEAAGVQGLPYLVFGPLVFGTELGRGLVFCALAGVFAFFQWHGAAPSWRAGLARGGVSWLSLWGAVGLWVVFEGALAEHAAAPRLGPVVASMLAMAVFGPFVLVLLWPVTVPTLLYALLSGALLGAWQARRGEVSGADEAPGR